MPDNIGAICDLQFTLNETVADDYLNIGFLDCVFSEISRHIFKGEGTYIT